MRATDKLTNANILEIISKEPYPLGGGWCVDLIIKGDKTQRCFIYKEWAINFINKANSNHETRI